MTTIAIIPARGGSTRIPRKNIKEFHGKPIIAYSIEKARASGVFDRIVVSTDDDEIAEVAKLYGAEVWRRDPAYGDDRVGTQHVTRECLLGLGLNAPSDYACCIYATSPLMDVMDLRLGYQLLTQSLDNSYVMTVGYPPLQDAGQFYWGRARDFIKDYPLISRYTQMIKVSAYRVCDINTPEDWARAERMFSSLEKKTR